MKLPVFHALTAAAVFALGTSPCVPAEASADPHVDAVLRASRAALHLDALRTVRTIHLSGAVDILGIAGRGELWQDVRSGTFTQVADAGPVSGAQGFDGTHAWSRDPAGLVWDDGAAAGRYGAIEASYLNRFALWSPDHGGATVSAVGEKTAHGRRYDVLRVTPPGALPFDLWIDAVSHLPAQSVATIGTTTSTTAFADYRSVGGLMIPFATSSESDGNAWTFKASSAAANDTGAAAALRRPVTHLDDFSLPSGTTTIPFELVDNHVALPVTIDGKGPFTFLFDTGGSNVIDAGVARELGLGAAGNATGSGVGSATESVQFATVGTLRVGEASLRKQIFAVAPVHAGFGMSSGKPVDGLIGFEVLSRFVTTFDYGARTIVLRTPNAAPALAGTTVPFLFNGNHVDIPCAIAGFAGRCTVDTGSRVALTVTSPFIAAHPSIVPPNVTATGADGFGVGGAAMGRLGRTSLEIAGFTIPDLITDYSTQTKGAFADPLTAGNIGAGVWKRFAVTLDYPHQRMSLVPNANFSERESYDRSGVFLITRRDAIVVADVRPGTPAAEARLVRGDVIVTAAGKSAAALGLAALRDLLRGAPGTPVPLTVTGAGGASRTVVLTLRDYV